METGLSLCYTFRQQEAEDFCCKYIQIRPFQAVPQMMMSYLNKLYRGNVCVVYLFSYGYRDCDTFIQEGSN